MLEDEMIGRAVGPYRIVKLLGVNLGRVYLAENANGEKAAIKVFHSAETFKGVVEEHFGDVSAQKKVRARKRHQVSRYRFH